MPTQPDPTAESGTCFVVMGFGKKTDFETGRVLDLDQSYLNLIKPAVEAARLKCIRADEIVHSGLIDVPMYEQLLKADVVVADISTSNRNALYELGVRHALRPYTTVIIAEEMMMKSPTFDLSHIVIRKYRHLGEDIGVNEARRFTNDLTAAIQSIMATNPELRGDSPVYKFIERLIPPSISPAVRAAVAAAASATENVAGSPTPVHSELMQRVDEAQTKGDWVKARMLLEEIREMRRAGASETSAGQQVENPEDPDVLQRLALATYKSKYPTPEEALKAARDLLKLLEPQTTNDTETLGLWGSVHKRLWELTKERSYLDQAVRAYERGFYLRNDYYNGINYAYLLNERAAHPIGFAEAVADFVQARRVRKEVVSICNQWLESNSRTTPLPSGSKFPEKRYWVLATLAEAQIGLEDEALGQQRLEEAVAAAPEEWMKQSTQEQVTKLKALLATSPLKKLSTTGDTVAASGQ
jgi:tetratricopeptide (TPR) repeat protein